MTIQSKIYRTNLKEVKFVNLFISIAMAGVLSSDIQSIILKRIAYGDSLEMKYISMIGSIVVFICIPIHSIMNYKYLVKSQIITPNRIELYKLIMIPVVFFVIALIVAGLIIAQVS